MKRLATLAAVLGWCVLAAGFARAAAPPQPAMVLAVHPYLPSAEIQKRFAPLARYLGRTLGRSVVVRVGRDYDEHVDAVGRNEVDIAFLGPSSYVLLVARYGGKPLLTRIEVDGKPHLGGVIVARSDSPMKGLADLKGKRFAFGDRESTMSTMVPLAMLQQASVPLSALASHEYLGGHRNVALGVLAGSFDAGAVKGEVYDEFAARGLRVLARMPTVSEHLFVTRSDMPATEVERLRRALLRVKADPQGTAILQSINKGMTGMVPVSDGDYDSLRAMMAAVGVLPK